MKKVISQVLVGILDFFIYFLILLVLIQFMVFVVPFSFLRAALTDKKGLVDSLRDELKSSIDPSKVS